jgi:glucose/arabinose dehydrogenase
VTGGFVRPIGIYHASPADGRLFIIEQAGRIRIVQPNGTLLPAAFLDLTDRVDSSDNEEGLLGLVFHPDYPATGVVYVNYTHTDGAGVRRTRISRFSVTADPNVADPASEVILLTVTQPFNNHNAGDLHFGPDGLLYLPLGDGGSGGDPNNNAQTATTLLGKIVRIDVDAGPGSPPDCVGDGAGGYTIPATNPPNPMIDGPGGACDEIWATGLRNPWRSSFDRLTGDLYLADVGQNSWEEINRQPANGPGGSNYGWRCYEGTHDYNAAGCGPIGNYTAPIFEYSHAGGHCSVTGGYVYRGAAHPAMAGRYIFTDYCTGNFWDLAPDGGGGWAATQHTNLAAFGFSSFGEDAAGELYVVNLDNGTLYRLQAN